MSNESEYIDTLHDGLAEAHQLLQSQREVSRKLAEALEQIIRISPTSSVELNARAALAQYAAKE